MRDSLALDQLGVGQSAHIVAIDWDALEPGDAHRLRNFGFGEGVAIETLHLGPFGQDPVAFRVGRMTVAIRRAHAAVIKVSIASQ